jgi:hypothetical protein
MPKNPSVTPGLAGRFASRTLFLIAPLLALSVGACQRSSNPVQAQRSPLLGSAESFAVLGGQAVTNTGPTTVTGSLGVSPGSAVTGFPPGIVLGGTIHAADAVALQARDDANAAYIDAAGQPCGVDLTGQDLGGQTLVPGVYCFQTSAQLTGELVLDTKGDPGAVFIFQMGSTLTTATDAVVSVIGGGGCNVYWQVGSSATLGTRTRFVGNIFALTSITLTTGASLAGRALAHDGATTMDTNQIGAVACGGPSDAGIGGNSGTGTGGDSAGSTGTGGIASAGTGGIAGSGAGGIAGVGGSTGVGETYAGVGGTAGSSCRTCTLCGDSFVDIHSDHDNCGGCSCAATTCDNICVKLSENPENCGACGHACAANEWCDDGACTAVCAGTVCNGWCTDLATDNDACGACGHKCGATEECDGGACVCTGLTCNSTCVDVSSSASDCGTCGHACGDGECCTAGECVPVQSHR